MYKVKFMEKTCNACPSQWEGMTECGKHIYIRYRSSQFFCGISADEDSAILGNDSCNILIEKPMNRGDYDGFLTDEEMMKLLAIKSALILRQKCIIEGKYEPESDAITFLMGITNAPYKVCYRAMGRAYNKGLIDYGVSLRTAWVK